MGMAGLLGRSLLGADHQQRVGVTVFVEPGDDRFIEGVVSEHGP